MRKILLFLLSLAILFTNSCRNMKEKADLLVLNGTIYTIDSIFTKAEAMAVLDGEVVATGSVSSILEKYQSDSVLDFSGKFIYPGFIDPHSHFRGYALGLQYVDLVGSRSFKEVMERISDRQYSSGQWVVGRGWDQNLWAEKSFPDNSELNRLFPDNPVMLIRIDGHVVLANKVALEMANVKKAEDFAKGEVEVKNGFLTGILSERAADHMRSVVPEPRGEEMERLLKEAQTRCFDVGLTTVTDAGLDYGQIVQIDSLQRNGKLCIHLYAMLTPCRENLEGFVGRGTYATDKLEVRSIKLYADGSLGSRTARLKEPYSDAPGQLGLIVTSQDSLRKVCDLALKNGYQVNTHCIGDAAVGMVLQTYAQYLKGKNDLRWRIEHAQVVDPDDMHYFGDFSIIPSVQATHATSDMEWAGERLGPVRIRNAYALKELLSQNGWLPNGTDFPIEHISPLYTFYASVARRDLQGKPDGGFQTENALSREEALRSITIWAARACFLEKKKGSLEPEKDADFIVLGEDLMSIPFGALPGVKVKHTFCRGVRVR